MLKKGEVSSVYIGARSAAVDLWVLGLLVHLNNNLPSVYEWGAEELQEYPGILQEVQDWGRRENIPDVLDIIIRISMYGAAAFLLSDLMLLCGIVMSNINGKWLILPWICFNIIYNVFICISPVIFVLILWLNYTNVSLSICVLTVLAICLNKFIITWHSIDVVIKQFMDKKSGLKSWKRLRADLTSDQVYLVS